MSIHEISEQFAAYLARELNSDRRQELRMAYGLEILLGEIVKLLVIILCAWMLGILPQVLTITISAGILRLASGGEHCSAYYRCLIGGTAWFLFLGWVVRSLGVLLAPPVISVTAGWLFFISLAIILKYAPGETENKPINGEAERKKFKKLSVSIMVAYGAVLTLFSSLTVLNPLVLPMAAGIMAQAFTVSPAGYNFIHFIDRILDFSKS
ncbi:MAG TPA: accessory gene regulator B family protein [Syntrophomonas sp.]|nr:accessory gene regulator B family protein [Syntrophomonas sp.]